MVRIGAVAFLLGWALPASGGFVNIDYCESSANIPIDVLAPYAPLLAAVLSADADVNGESFMEDNAGFKCQVGGNTMPDCTCELALVSELLRNQEVDLTGAGGVSHQMVYDSYVSNYYVLRGYISGADYDVLRAACAPLLELIYGHLVIGNGAFQEMEASQFSFSGSGGYALALIYALPTTVPVSQAAFDLASYSSLPQYLACTGDADADGYSNLEEFMAAESAQAYVAGALDRSLCGSQPLGGSEGEGEGEEGEGEEGEGEGEEGEGEGEPFEEVVPAVTDCGAIILILALLGAILFRINSRSFLARN